MAYFKNKRSTNLGRTGEYVRKYFAQATETTPQTLLLTSTHVELCVEIEPYISSILQEI